jgi:hypothetical protein
MSDAVTIADIYKLFERTEAQFAEFQKEADRRSAEADRRSAEADRRREEANRTMEELKKQVQETTKAVNSLTTPLCLFIEEMVEPAVVGLFQEWGIDVTQTMSRLKSKRPGAAMEIDIVAVNGSELVAVGIDVYAYRRGLFVIKQSGETVKIINDAQFQPLGFAEGV